MNRKFVILFFLLLIQFDNLIAQKTYFGFDTGLGKYEMTEIKQIIENSMNVNVLKPHCVSNFPGYLFFRPYLNIEYQYLNVGIAYTLMSTGSRYSIRDYSGEYKFDAQIIGNSVGTFVEIPLYTIKSFKFLIATESGMIFNTMKLYESIELTDLYEQQNDFNLKSFNVFVKPYLKSEYIVLRNISANILIGYHKDVIAKNMRFKGDNSNLSDFFADWDGMRASIGISYSFN